MAVKKDENKKYINNSGSTIIFRNGVEFLDGTILQLTEEEALRLSQLVKEA